VEKVRTAHELLNEAVEDGVASDATGKNALVKLRTATAKVASVEVANKNVVESSKGEGLVGEEETGVGGTEPTEVGEETVSVDAAGGVREDETEM
jgi:hypothetical protein